MLNHRMVAAEVGGDLNLRMVAIKGNVLRPILDSND